MFFDSSAANIMTDHKVKIEIDGAKEIASSIDENLSETRKSAFGFLGKISNGAAEELGLLFENHVKFYRVKNALNYMTKLQEQHQHLGLTEQFKIDPKLLIGIAESVAVESDDNLQKWWVGITLGSMSENPTDSNLPFIDIMKKLTVLQCKVFELGCRTTKISVSAHGLFGCENTKTELDELIEHTGCKDVHVLDRECDLLRYYGLIENGFTSGLGKDDSTSPNIDLRPTVLGLEFFARCNGHLGDLLEFYQKSDEPICSGCGMIH